MSYDLDSNPFWDFSVRFYRLPGVASACLRLQTSLGLDVNLLLFSVWSSTTGAFGLDLQGYKQLIDDTAPWHHGVVRTMRQARQTAKAGHPLLSQSEAETAYRSVLAVELGLERYEQLIIIRAAEMLEKPLPLTGPIDVRARRNMDLYLEAEKVSTDDEDGAALDTIASALLNDGA